LLNLELLRRQLEYAVFLVNLISDLTEKVGDIACNRCRSRCGCRAILPQALPRRHEYEGCRRRKQQPSKATPVHYLETPQAKIHRFARSSQRYAREPEQLTPLLLSSWVDWEAGSMLSIV